jgi:hypothetical protein
LKDKNRPRSKGKCKVNYKKENYKKRLNLREKLWKIEKRRKRRKKRKLNNKKKI